MVSDWFEFVMSVTHAGEAYSCVNLLNEEQMETRSLAFKPAFLQLKYKKCPAFASVVFCHLLYCVLLFKQRLRFIGRYRDFPFFNEMISVNEGNVFRLISLAKGVKYKF